MVSGIICSSHACEKGKAMRIVAAFIFAAGVSLAAMSNSQAVKMRKRAGNSRPPSFGLTKAVQTKPRAKRGFAMMGCSRC